MVNKKWSIHGLATMIDMDHKPSPKSRNKTDCQSVTPFQLAQKKKKLMPPCHIWVTGPTPLLLVSAAPPIGPGPQ